MTTELAELAEQIKAEIADHKAMGLDPMPLAQKYVMSGLIWNQLAAEVSGVTLPRPQIRKPKAKKSPAPDFGPGTELQELADLLDIQEWEGCACEALKKQMNVWQSAGCRKHFHEIVGRIKDKARQIPRRKKFRAAWLAVRSGLAFRFWRGVYRGLVDEAIRRAESKSTPKAS